MLARTTAFCVVLVAGCAGTSRNVQTVQREDLTGSARSNLFVGHSTNGDLVVAANHYDAMGGLATTAEELGIPARKGSNGEMLCQREMLTGTHVPRWICRYEEDVRATRQATVDWMDQPRVSIQSKPSMGAVLLGGGPGGGRGGTLVP
jgi:hypothetical protein